MMYPTTHCFTHNSKRYLHIPPSDQDNLGDLLNASANRVKKTKVDVKSENAARFREMFDKGEVPEGAGGVPGDRGALGAIAEKEQGRGY